MIIHAIKYVFGFVGATVTIGYALLKIYQKIVMWTDPNGPIDYDPRTSTVKIDGKVYSSEMIREFVTLPKGTIFRILDIERDSYRLERINEDRLLVTPSR